MAKAENYSPGSKLVVSQSPAKITVSGSAIEIASGDVIPYITVEVKDINDSTVVNSNAIVEIAISGDATLSCENPCKIKDNKATIKFDKGIAIFNSLKIGGKVDATYRLSITTDSNISATSFFDSFKINKVGTPSKLIILNNVTGEKNDISDLGTFEPPYEFTDLKVKVTDNYGNPVKGKTLSFEVIEGYGKLSDEFTQTGDDGIATLKRWYWEKGKESGKQQLTASVNNQKVTYTAEIYYPASKLTITETPINAQKFKINIGDLIAAKRKEYRTDGFSILMIKNAIYSDEVANAAYKRTGEHLVINVNDDKNPHNKKILNTALFSITTKSTELSRLGKAVTQEIILMPQKCNKGPVIASPIISGGGQAMQWSDDEYPKNPLKKLIKFDIPKYQIEDKYKYKLNGSSKYATLKNTPVYYECNTGFIQQDKQTITIPSMSIENEAQIGEIQVELQDRYGSRLSSATHEVTVDLNRQPYPPLQCIDENHCEDVKLLCSDRTNNCKKVAAVNGIATFSNLVLNGQVGKTYSLQFITGELSTENDHKSQVYIYKAGEFSASRSEIKVEEGKESIIADGESTATITVHLKDASGNPITGKEVLLKTDIGTFENEQSIVVTDKGNGSYEAPITSSTISGTAKITAEFNDFEITAEKVVEFKAGEATKISTISRRDDVWDDFGISVKSSFSVTITDHFKNLVEEQDVTFRVEGGGYIDNNGTTFVTVSTNSEGIATLDEQRWILGDQTNHQILTASVNGLHTSIKANTRTLNIHNTPTQDENEEIYFGDFIYQKITAARADDFETFAFIYRKSELKTFDLKEKEDTDYIRSYLEQQHKEHQILFLKDGLDNEQEFTLYSVQCEPIKLIAKYTDSFNRTPGWYGYANNILSTPQNYILPPNVEREYPTHWKERPVYHNCKYTSEILTFPKTSIANGSVLNGYKIAFYDTENNVVKGTNHFIKVEINNGGSLSCNGGGDSCLTAQTNNGVATFNNLEIKGKVGHIYNLTFTSNTGLFTTENNHKSQVYIYKAGEFSKDISKIDVEEGKESITADGESASIITVHLKDASGNPIMGKQVILTTTMMDTEDKTLAATYKGDGLYTATLMSTKAGSATITAKVNNEPINANATVDFEAGEIAKLFFQKDPSSTAINGEYLDRQPKILLQDAFGNYIVKEGIEISAKLISEDCENADCTSALLTEQKEVQTNENGEAIFTQLALSGLLNKEYKIQFEAGELASDHKIITINKPGKPSQIKINQASLADFKSGSSLAGLSLQIQDSGGNEVESKMIKGAGLIVKLENPNNAKIACIRAKDIGCITIDAGSIEIPVIQPTISLDSVTLAGKIGKHELEAKLTIGIQPSIFAVEIKKAGPPFKIFIVDVNECKHNPFRDISNREHYCYRVLRKGTKLQKVRLKVTDEFDNLSVAETVNIVNITRNIQKKVTNHEGLLSVTVGPTSDNSLDPEMSSSYNWIIGKTWPFNDTLVASIHEETNNQNHLVTFEIETPKNIMLNWPYNHSYNYLNNTEYLPISQIGTITLIQEPKKGTVDQDDFSYSVIEKEGTKYLHDFKTNVVFDEIIYQFDTTGPYKQFGDKIYGYINFYFKTDPLYENQWYLYQSKKGGIDLTSAILLGHQRKDPRRGYAGYGIKIGLVGDNIYNEPNELEPTKNKATTRKTYSSTQVAGIIGANGWNNTGIRGIAPSSLISEILIEETTDALVEKGLVTSYILNHTLSLGGNIDCKRYKEYLFDDEADCNYQSSSERIKEKYKTSSNIDIFILIEEPNLHALEFIDKNLDLFWSGEKPISKYDNSSHSSADTEHKRSIFIRGAGNSNNERDKNTNIRSLGNHLALINVAALNTMNKVAKYSHLDSTNWISAPGGEDSPQGGMITTCYETNKCVNKIASDFYGISAAAAVVTGVVALMLEANSELTWRDVKYILAKTAVHVDIHDQFWVKNDAQYRFNNAYGFGAIDAEAAVKMAQLYTPGHLSSLYKEQNTAPALCTNDPVTKSKDLILPDLFIESVELKIQHLQHTKVCDRTSVPAIFTGAAHVISEKLSTMDDLEIILTSPRGTKFSNKIPHSEVNKIITGIPLKLYTHAFYGEKSQGNWSITFIDNSSRAAFPFSWLVTIYGTKTDISKNANQ